MKTIYIKTDDKLEDQDCARMRVSAATLASVLASEITDAVRDAVGAEPGEDVEIVDERDPP